MFSSFYETFKRKDRDYQVHGFTVLWLMGQDLWLKDQITELQKNLVYFSEKKRFYYWELDFKAQKMRLKSLIHEDLREKLFIYKKKFLLGKDDLLSNYDCFLSQKLLTIPLIVDLKLAEFIRRQLYYCSPKWLKLQEKYYQRGENLLNLTFERSFIAPLGLNLLEVFDDKIPLHKFTQIKQNINLYYEKLLINFQQNSFKAVYPPRFYAIMKKQKKDMNE
ncbi:hypothetical protein [Lactococcus lactis]|uniref:hypothetical protein n=1 Tax=Lactococcus lactis TaxID=1358 RepID=UPI0028FD90E8|nr:hypothetical protein [Lactococcus lactis]MDU0399165.1 hypothetical protein [Lactococcus lactis]